MRIINFSEAKECKDCKEEKLLNEFYSQKKYSKRRGNWIYYDPVCKVCRINRQVDWQGGNREYYLTKMKYYNSNLSDKSISTIKESNKKRKAAGKEKDWQRKNPDKLKLYSSKKHKHEITKEEWEACLDYFEWSCAYCGFDYFVHLNNFGQQLHKDHVNHDGNNFIDNCAPACRECNSSKHDRDFIEWYNPLNKIFTLERLERIINWVKSDWMTSTE